MNNSPPPRLTTPDPPRQVSFKPVLITVAVAFLLLVGSVCGAFATCGSFDSGPSPSFKFFTSSVYFFLAVFAISIAWLLLSLFLWLLQKLS